MSSDASKGDGNRFGPMDESGPTNNGKGNLDDQQSDANGRDRDNKALALMVQPSVDYGESLHSHSIILSSCV